MVVGEHDGETPPEYSVALAETLPNARPRSCLTLDICRRSNSPIPSTHCWRSFLSRDLTPVDLADPALFGSGIPASLRCDASNARSALECDWRRCQRRLLGGHPSCRRRGGEPRSETFSSAVGHIQIYDIDDDALDERASMIDMDPPIHTRLRRLVSKAFTHAMCSRTPRRSAGSCAGRSCCRRRRLGRPCRQANPDRGDLRHLGRARSRSCVDDRTVRSPRGRDIERPVAAGCLRQHHAAALVAVQLASRTRAQRVRTNLGRRRREDPQDDLITKLIEAEIDCEHLSEEEFANFFRLMIFAGNETTRSSMSHLALYLVDHPEQVAAVRSDRTLLAGAAEEVVRYSSPILYFRRTATATVS